MKCIREKGCPRKETWLHCQPGGFANLIFSVRFDSKNNAFYVSVFQLFYIVSSGGESARRAIEQSNPAYDTHRRLDGFIRDIVDAS
jgi:hypothetical protein